ncbi:putative WD repeat-containing protein alr3466 [Talaromyces islandicus]|uniref:Putative WD repeat-containing protein alr3466 n=1 Tax=Talaromyces islandicus TaxID=28573 RepID=A0A0U1MAS1_TALIS|nr:putative WD repeat-containing protein alr3466 [Talaromyces islandicus]
MATRRQPRLDQYTVGWVSALPIELAAAQEMLDDSHDTRFRNASDTNIYTLGRIGRHNVVIACLPYSQMGTNSAAVVASQMKSTFPTIQFIFMVGIGGGVPHPDRDIRLGDVVVSQSNTSRAGVIQYDFGKATKSGFQRTGFLNNPPPLLLKAIAQLEANHNRERIRFLDYVSQLSTLEKFKKEAAGPDLLFRANYEHVDGDACAQCSEGYLVKRKPRDKNIVVHYGTIASGNQVVKNALKRDKLSSELGGVLCFEMEAAGLMNDFPCLVIRGICDYSDSHKNKGWQGYAAGTAAAYTKELLSVIPPIKELTPPTSAKVIAERDDILNQLPYAVDAPFNSYKRRHDPVCLRNTRVNVLHKIKEWIHQQDEPLFWLNGLAGTGKSTIARTIARESDETGILGASFFFSRGGGDVGVAQKFVTSIARQLALQSPILREYICDTVQQHQDIAHRSLVDQWHWLVTKPLSKIEGVSYPPVLIVIDALDECDNDDDIMIILRLLAEAQPDVRMQLRFFLTSRPEVPVRRVLNKLPENRRQNLVLHEIVIETNNDLSIFFKEKLAEIAESHNLGAGWPGRTTIQTLIDRASGLFIWAATACRFIDDGKQFASVRLSAILQNEGTGNRPQDHLDNIYITVFLHSISTSYTKEEQSIAYSLLRYVLGSIVVLFSQLPMDSVATLLGLTGQDIYGTLKDLHSILAIPDKAHLSLRLHHPSLRNFLLDEQRCANPNLHVNEKDAHRWLLISCIRLMSVALKKDICGLHAPGTSVETVPNHQIEQCLPPELQYACLYWGQHLFKSGSSVYDNDFIHQFVQEHLLHWLEALSLMGRVPEAILVMNSLSHMLTDECPCFRDFIQDAKRFVQYNQYCLQQTPLQVYFSALVFAPVKSIIRNQFKEEPLQWIRRIPEISVDWSQCLQTLEGHSGGVNSVAFTSDGKMLASASDDNTIRLWDITTGQCMQILEGHSDSVNSVTFISDRKMLVSTSYDKTICLWDTTTGQCMQTLEGHSDRVNSVAFTSDGKMLASASNDKTIRLWDITTGQCMQTLKGHSGGVNSVAFTSDGKTLASASHDKTIRLWDITTGQCMQTLKGHSGGVNSVAFTSDGKMLASASNDKTIRLWDTTTGQCMQTLEGHRNWVNSITFISDRKILASTSYDKTIRLWDTTTGQCMQILEGHRNWINSVAFTSNSKMLASASNDKTIRLWDITTGQCMQILEGHSDGVISVAFTSDGKTLASASHDKTIRLWDITTGQCMQTLEGHSGMVISVAFTSDRKMLASTSYDKTIRLWDTTTGQCMQTLEGHSDRVYSVAFTSDRKILASTSYDKTIRLWDTTTGQCMQTLEGHSGWINSAVFTSDGKMLASTSNDKTIRLWDTTTGQCMQTLEGYSDGDISATFTSDGKMLDSTSHGNTILFQDITTDLRMQTLEGHSDRVTSVAFTSDGKILASTSFDKTIRFWDTTTGQCMQTLEGHRDWVTSVTFISDGKTLASTSYDKTIRLWDITTGQCMQILEGHSDGVISVTFTSDRKMLASASNDKTIRLWDTTTGQCMQTLESHRDWVTSVAFTSDGKMLASTSYDKTIRLWDTTTGQCMQTLEGHCGGVNWVPFVDNHVYMNTNRAFKMMSVNLSICPLKTRQVVIQMLLLRTRMTKLEEADAMDDMYKILDEDW